MSLVPFMVPIVVQLTASTITQAMAYHVIALNFFFFCDVLLASKGSIPVYYYTLRFWFSFIASASIWIGVNRRKVDDLADAEDVDQGQGEDMVTSAGKAAQALRPNVSLRRQSLLLDTDIALPGQASATETNAQNKIDERAEALRSKAHALRVVHGSPAEQEDIPVSAPVQAEAMDESIKPPPQITTILPAA